ncbi:MAG: anthranilate synthase component I family protein [Deltaproteobacteria bacterium]|nr:anthranilate synthase component I family protein [Deltaproteobacteria bacterium]
MRLYYEKETDLELWLDWLENNSHSELLHAQKLFHSKKIQWNMTKDQYQNNIEKIKYYLKEGDIYQVNFAQRFCVHGSIDDFISLLPSVTQEPHGAYLNFPDNHILSFSMERFIKISGDEILTQPIKGTVAKGCSKAQDDQNKKWLENSYKNAAEHVMIVDLERNDLSQVCQVGSINVPVLKRLYTFSTLHHLVSTVQGRLLKYVSFIDVLRAVFPGGSITGAPKLAAQQIIEELEPVCRGLYTGSIGFIDSTGFVDFNIAIRTLIHRNGFHYYSVGGGIVYDSTWEEEYEETLVKSQIILEYLGKGHRSL